MERNSLRRRISCCCKVNTREDGGRSSSDASCGRLAELVPPPIWRHNRLISVHRRIDFLGPRIDSALEVKRSRKAGRLQQLHSVSASNPAFTERNDFLIAIQLTHSTG